MITFCVALVCLVLGFIFYGKFTEKQFGPDDRTTPAIAINDGVDCVPIKSWKALLIQLLNIAGTGPIFGALMGACFGPIVFLWIVLGAIFGGAVHDYMCGMISERNGGASIADLSGKYLGKSAHIIMRIFSVLLLLLTGTVFVNSPAALLSMITPDSLSTEFWVAVILIYYIVATLLPIDQVIGRFYPVFGFVLILMAVTITGAMIFLPDYHIPELSLRNLHPQELPVWPFMFITVACGAISGFHSTQSPMIAKCITSEREGRKVFYGAMIIESVIALVWAAAGMTFFGDTALLNGALTEVGQSGTVYEISNTMLGAFGGMLAIIGVVACPITSGDTAFRSARLIIAEWTRLDQKIMKNRLIITIPLLLAGAILTRIDFNVIWRYFSWANQTLATIALCVATAYLIKNGKHKSSSLITALPGSFMMAVTLSYILIADEGFRLPRYIGCSVGIIAGIAVFVVYCLRKKKYDKEEEAKLIATM